MKPKVKLAVVGAGYMASEHLKAFASLNDVILAGIYSRTRKRAEKLAAMHPGMVVCDSVDELFEKTKADLVVVTVNELSMADMAIECFKYSWTILLEKPAGYDFSDATRIVDAANHKLRRIYVALNRRSYSSTRQALSYLQQTDGRRFIKVIDQQDQKAALEIYNEPLTVAQNYMFANSIHLVDYFHVFGRGDVINVTNVVPWNPAEPWVVVAKIDFSSGDVGLYEGIWDGPGPWSVAVSTSQSRLEMRPLEQASIQLRGERKVTALELESNDINFKPGLYHQAVQAIAAVRGEKNQLPTLGESLKSMKLVAQIFGILSYPNIAR